MKRFLFVAATACLAVTAHADENATATVTVTHAAVEGIGVEPGVMPRSE